MSYDVETEITTIELNNQESVDVGLLLTGRIIELNETIAYWEATNPSWLESSRQQLARITALKIKIRGW